MPRSWSAFDDYTNGGDLVNLVRDDSWVDNIGPSDQRGANRMEGGTLFELGGSGCRRKSVKDAPYVVQLER